MVHHLIRKKFRRKRAQRLAGRLHVYSLFRLSRMVSFLTLLILSSGASQSETTDRVRPRPMMKLDLARRPMAWNRAANWICGSRLC